MKEQIRTLSASLEQFMENKELIVKQWLSYKGPKKILTLHEIDTEYFRKKYASGVFDYFMGVISGDVEIGNCPVMKELLEYFKKREISADELFEICSHFRRSMIDFSYDLNLNSKKLFDEISYIFDENFKGILKYYTDTIFQKLIDARQEAIQASQAKEYFLSNMSHEIRTPLNAVLGFVNLLLHDDMSKKHRKYLDIIHSSGESLLSIINDILDFSKLRSGEFTIEDKEFSLHEELTYTMELFVGSANLKNILISSFINPEIPMQLYGDILRIKQILSNFLSNAIKFTPENGLIHIEANYSEGMLCLSVRDNGIGIKEEDIDNVFAAFTQAQNSAYTKTDGTGLGLSICAQLAKRMGGEVTVASTLGFGSLFTMHIPLHVHTKTLQGFKNLDAFKNLKMMLYTQDANIDQKQNSFLEYAKFFGMHTFSSSNIEDDFDVCIFSYEDVDIVFKQSILDSSQKFIVLMSKEYDDYEAYRNIYTLCFPLYCSKIHKAFLELFYPQETLLGANNDIVRYKGHILLVEDNEANQELMKIILQKCGLSYDIAHNGLEALEIFKEKKYDLVLMDEQMPVMNGDEAVGKMIAYEESKGVKHTPISALTANVLKGAKERGLLNGFDAFLGKPINLKELYRLFSLYLKRDNSPSSLDTKESRYKQKNIVKLKSGKLAEELMLSKDEVKILLSLFMKKMLITLPKLEECIVQKDYKNIALLAHSIKGSSGNFRLEFMQEIANEMESMAKKEEPRYNYRETFLMLKEFIESLDLQE